MMAKSSTTASGRTGGTVWRAAPLHALAGAALMLSLFAYWFAVADRYTVFLYDHDMGPLVPDTSPFSRVTSSRYWMAGLVAGGAVLVLYGAANGLLGRLRADYGYHYISDSDNFFTSSVPLQVATWLVVAGVAAGLTRLRQALETRRL
jgi:hypothetical protein